MLFLSNTLSQFLGQISSLITEEFKKMKPELLIKVNRANLVEKQHFGFIIVTDKNEKIISEIGKSNETPFFLRSCAKPFQALPVITSGTFKKYNFSLEELAVCCASHVASKEHIKFIQNILNKTNLSEKHLKCGSHDPIDTELKNHLIKNDLQSKDIHNNCSGKHAGMLAVCINNGWPLDNYLDFTHPLQIEIKSIIEKYCNIANPPSSLDGCSAPVYAAPLHKIGAGFLRLFLSDKAEYIRKAYKQNPVLIGGKGRLDSSIIEASNGKLISKVGADGLCVVINPEEEKALIVKIIDADQKARSITTIECLQQLDWLNAAELNNESIKSLHDKTVKNFKDILVGEIEPVFKI